mmetsp:Transcript_35605/g.88972  ORF Transcript_35605/g.88972 Transcript_35605/m.88972 type:complete len:297 (+) Transcript_35605:321-1211(+)
MQGVVAGAGRIGGKPSAAAPDPRGRGRDCPRGSRAPDSAHPGAAAAPRDRGVCTSAAAPGVGGRQGSSSQRRFGGGDGTAGRVQPAHAGRVAGTRRVLLQPCARNVRAAGRGARRPARLAPHRRAALRRNWPRNHPQPAVTQLPALQPVRPGGEAPVQGAAPGEPLQPTAVPLSLLPGSHSCHPTGVLGRQGVPDAGAPQGAQGGQGVRTGAGKVDHCGAPAAGRNPREEGPDRGRLRAARRAQAVSRPDAGGAPGGPGKVPGRHGGVRRRVQRRQNHEPGHPPPSQRHPHRPPAH